MRKKRLPSPAASALVTEMTLEHPTVLSLSQPDGSIHVLCVTPWGQQQCRLRLTTAEAEALVQDLRTTLKVQAFLQQRH